MSDRLLHKYAHKIPLGIPNMIVYCIISSEYVVSWFELMDNIENGRFYILFTSPGTELVTIEFSFC